jgi:hypothetical protein
MKARKGIKKTAIMRDFNGDTSGDVIPFSNIVSILLKHVREEQK